MKLCKSIKFVSVCILLLISMVSCDFNRNENIAEIYSLVRQIQSKAPIELVAHGQTLNWAEFDKSKKILKLSYEFHYDDGGIVIRNSILATEKNLKQIIKRDLLSKDLEDLLQILVEERITLEFQVYFKTLRKSYYCQFSPEELSDIINEYYPHINQALTN